MTKQIDEEIEAIKTLLLALDPLTPEIRRSVLQYVLNRLNISIKPASPAVSEGKYPPPQMPPSQLPQTLGEPRDIRQLKDEKQPKSAIEMAVLVAYYLSSLAPKEESKQTITTKDIDTYFRMAGFRLPSKPEFTLPNTKKAGYLDSVGAGEYKLSPVGYNLVVHGMPKTEAVNAPARKKRSNKKTSAKTHPGKSKKK